MTKQNDILKEALEIINADRRVEYGDAKDSFTSLAKLWTWYLKTKHGFKKKLDGGDVAMIMCLMKISRHTTGKPKKDNLVDLAGYAALAGQFIPDVEPVLMAKTETTYGTEAPKPEEMVVLERFVYEAETYGKELINEELRKTEQEALEAASKIKFVVKGNPFPVAERFPGYKYPYCRQGSLSEVQGSIDPDFTFTVKSRRYLVPDSFYLMGCDATYVTEEVLELLKEGRNHFLEMSQDEIRGSWKITFAPAEINEREGYLYECTYAASPGVNKQGVCFSKKMPLTAIQHTSVKIVNCEWLPL